jgi:hypothetical protein
MSVLLWQSPATAANDEQEREEEEDEFGEELVWIDARAGYSAMDLVVFEAHEGLLTAGLVPSSIGGPAMTAGLGVRLWFITIGPRMTLTVFDTPEGRQGSFNLWSADGEIGFRIPLGRVEPHLTVAGGYSAVGGISDAVEPIGDSYSITGANVRAGAGLDVYLTENVSVGADGTAEALILSRPGVPLAELASAREVGSISQAEAEILEADGAATGYAFTVVGGFGVHF